MIREHRHWLLPASACLFLALTTATLADIGRPRGLPAYLKGEATIGNEKCTFTVEIDDLLFRLNTVKNKYRLVRIVYENRSTSAITLSADDDTLDVVLNNDKTVRAFLNLQKSDPEVWNTFDDSTRKILAYPEILDAKKATIDTGHIYVWVPADAVIEMPKGLDLAIKSLSASIKIRRPPASAARADASELQSANPG